MPQAIWFKPRAYPHFDRPLDEAHAIALATDRAQVERRAFLPFISFKKRVIRYKVVGRDSQTGKPVRRIEPKDRPLAFASHSDSAIYAYYAHLLSQALEARLAVSGLSECVLAYRRFPDKRCNIQFADEAFGHIDGIDLDAAVCLDIEKFFDTLNHGILKGAWADLLGSPLLPRDHFNVFKAITRFARVDRRMLYAKLGISTRRAESLSGPLCTPKQFRELVRASGLVLPNEWPFGIPQGSPISAVLSNLYMLSFDVAMKRFCDGIGAIYRRYSDDILVLCNRAVVESVEEIAQREVAALKLVIQNEKTVVTHFERSGEGMVATRRDGKIVPMQYLGFTFDGNERLLRPQTLAKFYRRMKMAVNQAEHAAKKAAKAGGRRRLFRRSLYEKFTHLRRFENFPNYAFRAANEMGSDAIRRQFRRHWPMLQEELKKADGGPRPATGGDQSLPPSRD